MKYAFACPHCCVTPEDNEWGFGKGCEICDGVGYFYEEDARLGAWCLAQIGLVIAYGLAVQSWAIHGGYYRRSYGAMVYHDRPALDELLGVKA